MASTPEPLQTLLQNSTAIVMAEVVAIVASAPARDGGVAPPQTVRLKVERVLKGSASPELVVEKPEAAYALKVGDAGPFFLVESRIIGALGPQTYKLPAVERALIDATDDATQ